MAAALLIVVCPMLFGHVDYTGLAIATSENDSSGHSILSNKDGFVVQNDLNPNLGMGTPAPTAKLHVVGSSNDTFFVDGFVDLGLGVNIPFTGITQPKVGYAVKDSSWPIFGALDFSVIGQPEVLAVGYLAPASRYVDGLILHQGRATFSYFDTLEPHIQYGFNPKGATGQGGQGHADLYTYDRNLGYDICGAFSFRWDFFIGSVKDTNTERAMKLNFGVADGRGMDLGMTNAISRNIEDLLFTVDTTGNVGIGVTNPAAKLDVKGDTYITDIGSGVIMKSPNGACWRLTPDNTGASVWTSIPCPTAKKK